MLVLFCIPSWLTCVMWAHIAAYGTGALVRIGDQPLCTHMHEYNDVLYCIFMWGLFRLAPLILFFVSDTDGETFD